MADFWFDKGLQAFANGSVNYPSDNIKFIACKVGYVAAQTTDQFISDIGGGNIVARTGNVSGKSVTLAGQLNAANPIFTAPVAGSTITHLVSAKDTGVDATSPLLTHHDVTSTATNGQDITVVIPGTGFAAL